MGKKVIKTCSTCKSKFELGLNGIYSNSDGVYKCDTCAGVMRDADGNAWEPGEEAMYDDNGTVCATRPADNEFDRVNP